MISAAKHDYSENKRCSIEILNCDLPSTTKKHPFSPFKMFKFAIFNMNVAVTVAVVVLFNFRLHFTIHKDNTIDQYLRSVYSEAVAK